MSIVDLIPVELQAAVLSRLRDDDASLLRCELVTPVWRDILLRGQLYRQKCLRLLREERPDFAPTFAQHRFELNSSSAKWCKIFYFKLRRLQRRGWGGQEPRVTVLDCLKAEVKGRRVEVSEDWKKRHNYTGLYDMVWDSDSGLLTCSVFNAIQVWDMNSNECLSIIGPEALDGAGSNSSNSSCFFAMRNLLVCGTERGAIKVFDLLQGNEVDQVRHMSHNLCDVKIYGTSLLAIDCYGEIQEWGVDFDRAKLSFVGEFRPPLRSSDPDLVEAYQHRFWERLLDFNERIVVTNCSQLFIVFSRKDGIAESCINTSGRILCCAVYGDEAYWGEQNGIVKRTTLWANGPEANTEKVLTAFEDNVTSIDTSASYVVIGDVNGEVHVCERNRFGKNPDHRPDFVIDTGHAYRSYVWAVHMDSCRIFSGDSDGKLVIHDFWDYEGPAVSGSLEEEHLEEDVSL